MIGILYYFAYLILGVAIAAMLLPDYKRHQIAVIGLSIGTLVSAWAPAGISLIFGSFNILTNVIALVITAAATLVLAYLYNKKTGFIKKALTNKDVKEERVMLFVSIPFLVLIAVIFSGHVLAEQYDSYYSGQSTYGDLAMHLGMITSIARQGDFPPMYSILPDEKLSYPFLVNSLSSSLYMFGTSLRMSVIIPSVVMSFVCFAGFFILSKKVSENNKSAVFATLLFFITGGLGFIYFLGDWDTFREIFTGFYKTPTNLPDLNLRWVNVICDMMVPQRTSLMGWSVLIPCMTVLYTGMRKKLNAETLPKNFFLANRELIFAGVIAGLMPMVHTHSFLALGILCTGALITGLFMRKIDSDRYLGGFIAFLIPVLVLATPQLFAWTFGQAEGFMRTSLDWVNEGWPWLKFWVVNVGVSFVLIVPAIIWGRKKYLIPFVGAWLIYAIAEVIVFQPNNYDNNKLLLVWYMVMCVLVGDFSRYLFDKIKPKALKAIIAVPLAVVFFASGALTIAREVNSNSQYMTFSEYHIEAAEAIDEYAPEDALFLTGSQHLNTVAALTGRNVFAGSNTFLYFHGFDMTEKYNLVSLMFNDSETSAELMVQEGIDYVFVSSYERSSFDAPDAMMADYPIVFDNTEVKIYAVSERAIEIGYLGE